MLATNDLHALKLRTDAAGGLVDFLNQIDKDEKLKQKYLQDPQGTAEAYGLDADDVKILTSGDEEAIKSRSKAAGGVPIVIFESK